MAINRKLMKADPQRVYEVLTDAGAYADWVVGAHRIRDTDATWPAVGSRLHHRVGIGPLRLNDHTEVIESDPPERFVLRARARPFGTAKVTMQLEAAAGGTAVTMTEVAGDPLSRLAINPFTDWLLYLRNIESLRRLARIGEVKA
jgi:uncharacterized protein YndB with AHSA1/START domain